MRKKKSETSSRLSRVRQSLGLSQRDMARELGVSSAAISLWEQGERPIPGPVLKLIESYERYLFPGAWEPPSTDELKKLSTEWTESLISTIATSSKRNAKEALRESLKNSLFAYLQSHLSQDPIQRTVQRATYSRLVQELGRTKGLPLKIFQLMSHLDPDIPSELRRALVELQSANVGMPAGLAAKVIYDEFGKRPRDLFADWSGEPFAAASIGQVHRARLKSGEIVAVKIQYPGIREQLISALKNPAFRELISILLHADGQATLDEFGARILEECDYIREAETQKRFRSFFENVEEVRIPQVFDQYCSKHVLTTEFIDGESFADFAKNASQEMRNRAAEIITRFQGELTSRLDVMHADIQPLNLLFPKDQVAFIDFGRVVYFTPEMKQGMVKLLSAILKDDPSAGKEAVRDMGIVKDWESFDFGELWLLLREYHVHFQHDAPFEISPASIARKNRLMRGFRQKSRIQITAPFFWNLFVISTNDVVRAQLRATCNWRGLIKRSFS